MNLTKYVGEQKRKSIELRKLATETKDFEKSKELKEEKQELIDYLEQKINESKLTGNDEDYIKIDVYEEILFKLVESDQIEKE